MINKSGKTVISFKMVIDQSQNQRDYLKPAQNSEINPNTSAQDFSYVSTELKRLHWFTATVYPALWNSRCSKYFYNLACFRAQTAKADSLFNSQNLYLTWYTITGPKSELICTVLVWISLLVATGFVMMLLILLQHQNTFDWHPHPAAIR